MEIYHQAIKRFIMSGGRSSGRMDGNNSVCSNACSNKFLLNTVHYMT